MGRLKMGLSIPVQPGMEIGHAIKGMEFCGGTGGIA